MAETTRGDPTRADTARFAGAGSSYKPRSPGTLKEAQDRLVNAAGGQKTAADWTRVSKSMLGRYTDDAEPACHMPVDVVRVLEARARTPIVTEFLAIEAGYALIPVLDGAGDVAAQGLAPQTAACAKEASEVFARLAAMLADGRITPTEAGEAIKEIDEVLSAFASLRALAQKARG
jgi:hypothetical protein